MEKANILIVDDDPDITEAIKIVLEHQDYKVKTAGGIEQAMESLKAERPDLIILDVMMDTQQDGFILSRQLKEEDDYKDIPILMLTAVNQEHGFSLTVGPDDSWNPVDCFIDKPVDQNTLHEKIKELLA